MDLNAIATLLAIAEDSLKFPELRHLHDEALGILREFHLEPEAGEEVEDAGE